MDDGEVVREQRVIISRGGGFKKIEEVNLVGDTSEPIRASQLKQGRVTQSMAQQQHILAPSSFFFFFFFLTPSKRGMLLRAFIRINSGQHGGGGGRLLHY